MNAEALALPICSWPDCFLPAAKHRGGMCRGHRARHERGNGSTSPLIAYSHPFQRFLEAAIALADADADDDAEWHRAIERARRAARAWVAD